MTLDQKCYKPYETLKNHLNCIKKIDTTKTTNLATWKAPECQIVYFGAIFLKNHHFLPQIINFDLNLKRNFFSLFSSVLNGVVWCLDTICMVSNWKLYYLHYFFIRVFAFLMFFWLVDQFFLFPSKFDQISIDKVLCRDYKFEGSTILTFAQNSEFFTRLFYSQIKIWPLDRNNEKMHHFLSNSSSIWNDQNLFRYIIHMYTKYKCLYYIPTFFYNIMTYSINIITHCVFNESFQLHLQVQIAGGL